MTYKKEIINSLAKQFDEVAGLRFIVNPQSFFIFDNPDIIATSGNRIFGVYIPSKNELENIDSLYRRIYLSRLVYPRDLRIILVSDDDDFIQKSPMLKKAVHRIANDDEINNVGKMIDGERGNLTRRMLSREVRANAANNYYKYSELLSYIDRTERVNKYKLLRCDDWVSSAPVTRWSNYNKIRTLDDTYETSDAVVFNRKKNKSSIKQNLDSLLNYALYRQYQFNEGRLYTNTNNNGIWILNTDIFSTTDMDSIGVSTLAYLGILPVSVQSMEDFDKICLTGLNLFRKNYGK